MTNRDAAYAVLRLAWKRLLSVICVTFTLALVFAYMPELSGAPGERVNRWSVLAWLFLGYINMSLWMKFLCLAKGQPESAKWWDSSSHKVAIALAFTVLLFG
jgi:hypothetical protein